MTKFKWTEENKKQYSNEYAQMKWISDDEIRKASEERDALLLWLKEAGVSFGYDETKLDCRRLAPGCRCCGDGQWSCLFINGMCNARCFYCPTTQHELGQPTTNTVQFSTPEDYIEYIERFQFKGIGLSGGEPLLSPERTLNFLSEIKMNFADSLHVWLYTNGTKVTPSILKQLKDAGLDEMRFDLVAIDYDLEKINLAAQYIPVITVEIPAVPDDYELMKIKLREMKEAGVQYLNLHQLRCTPHNCSELMKRGYTFLHGPRVTVLESELTALKLIKYSIEERIDLPINYCSFIYKNRYQGIAAQKRYAEVIKKNFEDITCYGMIRTLSVTGNPDDLNQLAETFKENGCDAERWDYDSTGNRFYFAKEFASFVDSGKFSLHIGYHLSYMKPAVSFMNVFKEIRLKSGKKIVIERQPACPEFVLHGKEAVEAFKTLFLEPGESHFSHEEEESLKKNINNIDEIWEYERIVPGLMDYY